MALEHRTTVRRRCSGLFHDASVVPGWKSHLVRDSHLQTLQCRHCGELKEYGRSTANNPEAMALLTERVLDDHADCIQWSGDPARARRERGVKVRLRHEFRKQQCGRKIF